MKKTGKMLASILVMLAMAAVMMTGCAKSEENGETQAPEVTYPLKVTDDAVAGGKFTGNYVDALKNGEGTITYETGDVYRGPVTAGAAIGRGTITYADGREYTGLVINGVPEGRGVMITGEGTYTGNFANGVFEDSQGTFKFDGGIYAGGFSGGKMKGDGSFTWNDGHVFTGVFEGEGEGVGDLTADGFLAYTTGLSFDGTLVKGEPTKGTFYWPNNSPAWTGNFTAFLTGYGDLDMGNGIFYRGPMFAGVLTNCDEWLATGEKVTIQYPEAGKYVGEKFVGEYQVDEATMKDLLIGTVTYPDGTVIEDVSVLLNFSFDYIVPEE